MKIVYYILYIFNDIMEDINTYWGENGIEFDPLGYYFYKRKIYWESKLLKQ